MRLPPYLEAPYAFPEFLKVRVEFSRDRLADPTEAVRAEVDRALPTSGIRPGDRVAVAVGSRGIANISAMLRALCDALRDAGAQPFIVPAMGSHGGATAEGQAKVLACLGISEESMGAPVRSSLDTVILGETASGVPVHFSRDALQAEHTVFLNRVKPHTKFKGPAESGLLKMLVVGLGKHAGALAYHRFALRDGFYPLLSAMGQVSLATSNLRLAVGVVENAFDETLAVEAVPAAMLPEREEALLALANRHFPRLPFADLDVLAVRRIGKEISGAGMDPNVTGRAFDLMESDFSSAMRATRVAVLGLSEKTGGNALGLGNADVITEEVFKRMDYETTLMNGLTSLSLRKAFIPVRMPTQEKALQCCFATIGPVEPPDVRAVIVEDTMRVTEFWASEALNGEISALPNAEIVARAPLAFDTKGRLIAPFA